MRVFSFNKNERLCNKKHIKSAIEKGNNIFVHPLKTNWIPIEDDESLIIKVLITVSKKKFKRAIDRNKIKRIIRESYRTNKHLITNQLASTIAFTITYIDNKVPEKKNIDKVIIEIFERFNNTYTNVK